MTDDDQRAHGPDEEQVRRLLAALGQEPAPMPAHVAARLDATLAELAAERDRPAGTVTELPRTDPPHTERARRWPRLLVAAAAVSVLGIGAGELVQGSGSDSMTAATAERAEDAGDTAAGDAGAGAQEDRELQDGEPEAYAAQDSPSASLPKAGRDQADRRAMLSYAPASLAGLESETLTADVQRLADFTLLDAAAGQATAPPARRQRAACAQPDAGPGDTVFAVRLDGAPATLLLHRAEAGERLAEVYACGDASAPVATTTVDAG